MARGKHLSEVRDQKSLAGLTVTRPLPAQRRERQQGQIRRVRRVRCCMQGCKSGGGGCFWIPCTTAANTHWKHAVRLFPNAQCVFTVSAASSTWRKKECKSCELL